MSNYIKVGYTLDGGSCDVPCDIANANCVDIWIDNGESGQGHVQHNIGLCEKHAENLLKKLAKVLGKTIS